MISSTEINMTEQGLEKARTGGRFEVTIGIGEVWGKFEDRQKAIETALDLFGLAGGAGGWVGQIMVWDTWADSSIVLDLVSNEPVHCLAPGIIQPNTYDVVKVAWNMVETDASTQQITEGTYRGRITDINTVCYTPKGTAIWITGSNGFEVMIPIANITGMEIVTPYAS